MLRLDKAPLRLSTGACSTSGADGLTAKGGSFDAQSTGALTQKGEAGRTMPMITGRTIFVSYYTPSP